MILVQYIQSSQRVKKISKIGIVISMKLTKKRFIFQVISSHKYIKHNCLNLKKKSTNKVSTPKLFGHHFKRTLGHLLTQVRIQIISKVVLLVGQDKIYQMCKLTVNHCEWYLSRYIMIV